MSQDCERSLNSGRCLIATLLLPGEINEFAVSLAQRFIMGASNCLAADEPLRLIHRDPEEGHSPIAPTGR